MKGEIANLKKECEIRRRRKELEHKEKGLDPVANLLNEKIAKLEEERIWMKK